MTTRNRKRLRDYLIAEELDFEIENGETSTSHETGIIKFYYEIYQNFKYNFL